MTERAIVGAAGGLAVYLLVLEAVDSAHMLVWRLIAALAAMPAPHLGGLLLVVAAARHSYANAAVPQSG